MRTNWMTVTVATVALWATPSCTDDGERPCDLWTASAVVSGRVTEAFSGGPIVSTEVEVQIAAADSCDGGERWVASKRVTTDGNGVYSATLELGNAKGVRCIGATEVNSGASTRGVVEFVGGCDDTRAPNELTLDISI